MTFTEAAQILASLIGRLRSATDTAALVSAKSELSIFRAENLPLSDKPLRPLRQIARAVLEDYEGVVTELELRAIKGRTRNYHDLVGRLNEINETDDTPELSTKLAAVTNVVAITQRAVETVKDVREVGIDKLTEAELGKIDELLVILTSVPSRLISES